MATETQTKTGRCETHGTVEATREVPRIQFPFIYYGLLRFLARGRPFHCPTCDAEVAVHSE
ncbi:MAG TPA: hypothetical protein VN781_02220 [Acidimicrobiales bacterium]|nr:hypothetical protein [Acidimicrobiales bacterium]